MAAVLACGPGAVLSHTGAAELYRILGRQSGPIEVSVPVCRRVRPPGVKVHQRSLQPADLASWRGVPVTTPECTLLDVAPGLPRLRLEAAINEADKQGLVDPEALSAALEGFTGRRGVRPLRSALERHTLTDSELERRFLPLARAAGLPQPRTQQRVNGFRVDFYWPELGLVVETDGLRYHRTPSQQARDRRRDQVHTAAGMTPLRFTYAQVTFEAAYLQATLRRVADRLAAVRPPLDR